MTAEQNSGMRKTVRQFTLALVACLAVAGGAALAAAPDAAPAGQQQAGANDDWPHATGTPAPPVD
ncbi:hypothetical protein ACIGEZ_12910 [Streptomyces sp. NPDC085481]|uniref:hypothetical protein n=1 Tax=Streptomyces sp. NPDC085481 TaxID=3365727 RepID=UPI0037D4004F